MNYKLKEGDIKLTITRDYIIIDTVYRVGNLGEINWEFAETISRSDTAACHKLLERLLVR